MFHTLEDYSWQSNMAREIPPFHDLSILYQSISQHKAKLWGFPIAMLEYQRVLGPCVRHGSKGHLLWQDIGHRVSCRGEEIVLQIFQSLQTSRYTFTKPLPNKYFLVIHQIAMETMAHSVRLISFIFSVAPSKPSPSSIRSWRWGVATGWPAIAIHCYPTF